MNKYLILERQHLQQFSNSRVHWNQTEGYRTDCWTLPLNFPFSRSRVDLRMCFSTKLLVETDDAGVAGMRGHTGRHCSTLFNVLEGFKIATISPSHCIPESDIKCCRFIYMALMPPSSSLNNSIHLQRSPHKAEQVPIRSM